ncbi:hypothetical protein AGMMS49546_10990 [Spirochaetia bacterium]|nr:hypothetical protein AGMMS49546_10990 [Spirochaetia bacterium]
MDAETARNVSVLLVKGRIDSVHIGGGEPFLNFDCLLAVICELHDEGIPIDYIETNAFWARNKDAGAMLRSLRKEGVHTLCISVDPFHAEYVPYGHPLKLAELCKENGLDCFLWKEAFLPSLASLDSKTPHKRQEIEQALSKTFIAETARSYGISLGGRAVNIEEEYARPRPLEELLEDHPCRNLTNTGHFHVDLQGFFIPPQCTGIRLPLTEMVEGLDEDKYLVFSALYHQGLAVLFALAKQQGFTAKDTGYPSTCNLCFHIRAFLADKGYPELDADHYRESLKHYFD